MKKFTLAVFSAIAFAGSVFSQATVIVQAPPSNGASTQVRAPNGNVSHTSMKACFLIRASELSALTGTNITNFGFYLINGTTGVPVTGNFTVYLQNTFDITYNKGTSFTGATTGMTTVFSGNMTLPVSVGATSINLTLAPNFTYNGGGLYVAYEWTSTGPFASNFVTYEANNALTGGCATSSSTLATAPDGLTTSAFRPACLIGAVNTASNEVSLSNIIAPGSVAQSLNVGHIVTVEVKNASIGTLNNIPVTMNVTGANTFNDVQTITSLAAGSSTVVSFSSFNPQNSGMNAITASVPSDQVPLNNSQIWNQMVTCSNFANTPAEPTTYTAGIGLTNPNTLVNRIKSPANASLAGLRLAVANASANPGNQIYGVLFDATGTLIAYTNTLTIGSTMLGTFVKFDFLSPQPLTAGTDYFIGMGQPGTGYFPLGAYTGTANVNTDFFIIPQAGGAPTPVNAGVFGFEAVFTSTNPVLTVTPSRSVICRGESVTLTASGGATYVWNNNATTPAIVVSPTATAGYTVTGTDANGCVNSKTYTQTVAPCTGLTANANDGQEIVLFPNPANNGKTTLSGLEGTNTVALYNVLGQLVSSQIVTGESVEINLNNQPSGNYLIKITNSYNQTKTLKFLNQN
ncbi:MAG: T9SS type A sorting domain-containing protein [Bacteroidia bacterium]|jgi:hypothetical protein|nr:T9SS type A sorting domain-containing protein [Bacteroidia bacterium]